MSYTQANSNKKLLFLRSDFQEKWQKYLSAFGEALDALFGDEYDKKIRLSAGLEHLLNKRFHDAYHELRHFEALCTTDSDRQIIHNLIARCLNENEMARAKTGDWVKKSSGGYYQIVKRTPEYAVIKQAFDSNLVYVKQSTKVDCFMLTITDLKTFQFLEYDELSRIKEFFSDNPKEEIFFLNNTDKMLAFREALLQENFQEASYDFRQFRFYRHTANKIAFIVNLKDRGDCIQVAYGFTSIVDDAFLKNHGEDDSDIKLRSSALIITKQDAKTAEIAIKNYYETYLRKSKDEILALKQEKQKHFLQKITDKLRPLGFKKKGARWTKPLTGSFCLEFEAQKSRWSDEYFFNISVYSTQIQYPPCYAKRIIANGKERYDWQFLSDEELNSLMDAAIRHHIDPIINTPLVELGEREDIWSGCACNKEKCPTCWVAKNLWDANQNG